MGPKANSRRALTLLESLVILLIAALLISVLLRSLAGARHDSKETSCTGRLSAIAKAALTYAADDPRELMIPIPDLASLPDLAGSFEWGGKAGRGQPREPGRVETSVWGTAAYRGPAHRPLNKLMVKEQIVDWNPVSGQPNPGSNSQNFISDTELDFSMYQCREDTGYAGGGFMYTAGKRDDQQERAFKEEGLTAYDHYGTSYAASTLWTVGGNALHQVKSQSVNLLPVSRVPAPAETVAYLEVPGRFAWLWGSWTGSKCESLGYERRVTGGTATIPGWHKKDFGFNVAFADAHVDMVEMKGCTRPPRELGPSTSYPMQGCEPQVSEADCFRCITIRGPRWRLDTLPAPPIQTPWILDEGGTSVQQVLE